MTALTQPTLVLNKNWQPIGIQPVARAICMVFNDNAKIVNPADYQQYEWQDWAKLKPSEGCRTIKLVGSVIRVPEVISVCSYSGVRQHTIVFNRKNLFVRDRYTCQYCGDKPGSDSLTVDHITPRSRGGLSTWMNCVLACVDCNRKKADMSVKQAGMQLLREPFKPKWSPLFRTKVAIPSWEKFLSEMYWNVALEP